jgi:hypothetical protein
LGTIAEKAKWKAWYEKNPDKARINNNKYRQSHKELVAKRERKYKDSLNGRFRGLLTSSKVYTPVEEIKNLV